MESNILIIVEGAKTEPAFFKRLSNLLNQKFEIYYLGTNIYTLYTRMKEIDFNGDLKAVLTEIHPEKRAVLSKKFAYTYLIFDCDAHHPKKIDTRNINEIVRDNFTKLAEMAEYFVDETDPTIGKLYINYPMMESYRDCDCFFDNQYAFATIKISDISDYKNIVSKRGLCNVRIDNYTKEQFLLLSLQNIYKLNKIIFNDWAKMSYDEYLQYSTAIELLLAERNIVNSNSEMAVINTSLFLIIDYYGNKNGFYDSLNV